MQRPDPRGLILSMSIVFAPLGCGDSKSDDAMETGSTGDATDGSTSTTTGDPTATSTTSDTTTGSDQLGPAQGITIEQVVVNQGVAVPVWTAADGFVAGNGRNAPLLRDRPGVVVVQWSVAADWTPREITARLHLGDQTYDHTLMVTGAAGENPAEWFGWQLAAEDAAPSAEFQVELLEPSTGGPTTASPVEAPIDGPAPVGFEDQQLSVEVVYVPTTMDAPGCDTMRSPTEQELEETVTTFTQLLPVHEVQVSVLESTIDLTAAQSIEGVNALIQLRSSEGLPPGAFVLALLPVCDNDYDGIKGMVGGAGTVTEGEVGVRTGVITTLDGLDRRLGFMSALMTGRRRVECEGTENGSDQNYPHEGGKIGSWGFGIIDGQFRHPMVHGDVASECEPAWVSDYGYAIAYQALVTINGW